MASATAWVQSTDIASQPTELDIKTFFGVPPDPDEKLDDNISRKRRSWNAKLRERKAAPAAEKKIKAVLRLIEELENRIKRGVADDGLDLELLREGFLSTPPGEVNDLTDLWRVLEELLAAGRLDEALSTAQDAIRRWPAESAATGAFAWLAAVASRSEDTTDTLRRTGLDAARKAVAAGMRSGEIYAWEAILNLDLGDPGAALEGLRAAETELDGLTPWLYSHRCEAHAGLGDLDAAVQDAIRAVEHAAAEADDAALRSNTANALIRGLVYGLLPINSGNEMQLYSDVTEVAAWCAEGVPEAEDHVRPFRLWAAYAAGRHYVGRWELRTLLAVGSGFLLLPLLNRSRSQPVWRVFHEGPEKHGEDWRLVAQAWFVDHVHTGLGARFPWNQAEEPVPS